MDTSLIFGSFDEMSAAVTQGVAQARAEQIQSTLMSYRWPLIIGGVVVVIGLVGIGFGLGRY